jgi:hypothetical protein
MRRLLNQLAFLCNKKYKAVWSNEVLDSCSKNPVVLKTKERNTAYFKSMNLIAHLLTRRY